LEAAAEGGSVEVLQFFFDNVERWSHEEWSTAMTAAARKGHVEAIRCLLRKQVPDYISDEDPNAEDDEEYWSDENGSSSGFSNISGSSHLKYERREKEWEASESRGRKEPLVAACEAGHTQVGMGGGHGQVHRLLGLWRCFHAAGALPSHMHSCSIIDCTCIGWWLTVTACPDRACMQVVQVLLEHGMGCCSNNALEAAARNGDVKSMQLLVQYGALLQPCWYSDAPVNKLLEGAITYQTKQKQ
jgi:hypothetical protein